jgi:ABC-type sulfate/molybdate transport systems ATPase subunit
MTSRNILAAQRIHLSFEQGAILTDIDFDLNEGECLALVGKSGAGKSSLVKILACLIPADSGIVLFRGQKLPDPRTLLIPGHPEIKLVNQDFDLDLFHTVLENLRIKLPGYVESVKKKLCDELLEITDLGGLANQQVRFLSGGEQQRLALARALISEPDILLLDEPFVHLDPNLRMRIERYIQQKVKSWGGSVIIVTHDGREAMSWADRIVYLKSGKVVRIDTPFDFYENPHNAEEASHFGAINAIQYQGKSILFRPQAYRLVENDGLEAQRTSFKFLGTHYENWFLITDGQEIVLYSQSIMDEKIQFVPVYVGA